MSARWLCIIAGTVLLLGILPSWPYAYYQILRLVVTIISAIVAYRFYKVGLQGWALAVGAIAVLFNPIYPIYLNRSAWTGIDLIAGMAMLIASGKVKNGT